MNAVKIEWREVMAKALEQGSGKGLPPPDGLREDGHYSLNKTVWQNGRVKRTLYYGVKGDMTTIGWWMEAAQGQEQPAPAVNGTGPKKASGRPAPPPPAPAPAAPEPVASEDVEPLILLTPAGGGAWRLSGYGVARAELIRALRLSLVHLVAREAGALIIDEVVAPEMAVVAGNGSRERIERIEPQARQKPKGRVKRTVSFPDDDLIDEDDAW